MRDSLTMKATAAIILGASGSGTSVIAARAASILGWPLASFGNYVRAEAARRGLNLVRRELQDVGMDLVRDPSSFCRAVVAQSRWRPGQSIIVDGLRHSGILDELKRVLHSCQIVQIMLLADDGSRETRLREQGELTNQIMLFNIDSHPVEKEILSDLASFVEKSIGPDLSEGDKVDMLTEILIGTAELDSMQSRMTSDYLIRMPKEARDKLKLNAGDLFGFEIADKSLVVTPLIDVARMRSATGRLESKLEGVDVASWLREVRRGQDTSKLLNE
jgi:bifunctional DNA-binding transcriptional regulator/antitoxin component of YhaV-PrlF toxin-antitoxin module